MRKTFKLLSSLLAVVLIISSFSAVVAAAPYSVTSGSYSSYRCSYDYDLNSSGKLTIQTHNSRIYIEGIGKDYLSQVKSIEVNISDSDYPKIEPLITIMAANCTATSLSFVSDKFKYFYSLTVVDAPQLTDLSFPEGTTLDCVSIVNAGITSLRFLDGKNSEYVNLEKCPGLTGELSFPDSVVSINLQSCPYVTKVSGKNIEDIRLANMEALKESEIPSGYDVLTWYGYSGKSFNIPSDAKFFMRSPTLETVTFESGRTVINGGMLADCTALKEVSIPSGVTKIQYDAFFGCSSMKKVSLPVSVEQITCNAFKSCYSLADVYYAGSEEQWNKIKVISLSEDFGEESDGEEYTLQDVFGEATIHFAVQPGWVEKDGQWYYYDENSNIVKSNWVQDGSRWYYFDASGLMATGWQQIGGKWYYFNSSGAMQTGWVSDGGKWYFMNSSGAMQTGWVSDGGKWYYMNSSGVMQTGWIKDGSSWYYMNSSGVMQTGWVKDGSSWYFMNSSGVMQTGWIKDGSSWYYMNSSGVMQTGWLLDGGKWYYLDLGSGAMVTGSRTIGGKTYNFDSSGVCLNP